MVITAVIPADLCDELIDFDIDGDMDSDGSLMDDREPENEI